jgi:hypothetical protein
MLNFTLPDPATVEAVAARLSDGGLELVPAGVAVMVLTALGAALVISALRRREGQHDRPAAPDDEASRARPEKVDA